MNRIFRIVWSQALQAWVVVSELATRRGKGGTRAVAAACLALALPAHAADRYWDFNGTAVGFGGTGTWNTTGLSWSPNGDGVSGPYGAWNNAALDNAIFGGTAGTVTLGTPITVHNLTFTAHGYVLTGNTLTLAGATPTVNINSGAATIGSSLAGTAGLTKTGVGVLDVNGPMPSDFDGVDIVGGTLHVAATGSVSAMHTTVAAGATLDAAGAFTGTAGDDTFRAQGTVNGTLAFGTGNDAVDFVGADIGGLVALDGGDGGGDRVAFDGMVLDETPALSGWERAELLSGTVLQLAGALRIGNLSQPEASVLVIDPASRLVVHPGAQVVANVANAGTIDAGSNRLGIAGGYTGNGGALQVAVSPGNGTSGGLDVAGDVAGTTAIAFDADGTEAVGASTSILVVSSPNDDLATAADFTTDGIVRLDGSALPWTLAQAADRNWYLNADAEALLPEIGGYAILPSVGRVALLENNRLLLQRMSAAREDTPRCGTEPGQGQRAYWLLAGDCRGVWMAAAASEVEVGSNPGFGFSGDTVGLFLGADVLLQDRGTRTLRGGVFVGFQRGNYWTTGANSTAQQLVAESNVRTETPSVGFYQSIDWRSGTYLDMTLVAHRPEATIAVADGFRDEVPGSRLVLTGRIGHRFATAGGWTFEPQLQLDAIGMHWGGDDAVEGTGKGVLMDDDVFGAARVALRTGRAFETAGGASIRPWLALGVQDTFGEKRAALAVHPGGGGQAQDFPAHALDLSATLDVGVEAELNAAVSLFGVLSLDQALEGTDAEQRQANLGVRVRW